MTDYYELRKIVSKLVPRQIRFLRSDMKRSIKQKGRKSNYSQFDLIERKFVKQERLLKTDEIGSFLEVSLRAQACPMPLNLDVWDGFQCGYGCKYCYADSFRESLYTSFFDNSKSIGLRHCSVEIYKRELDKLFKSRGKRLGEGVDERVKAISMEIPMRFGIRFEDFLPIEGRKKISLGLLQYLADNAYPVMINTKSDLIGREDYVRAMTDNPGKAAVHMTMITSDDSINRKLEPGAPSFYKRIWAARQLFDAGTRVVARIEPFMVFINDDKEKTKEYIESIWDAGIRHVTFDTYSYSANSPRIRAAFYSLGYDFERMFSLMSDCQWLGSLLLGKFMDLFRNKGLKCSTFDAGNSPTNSDLICCCVGDLFTNTQWNLGSIISMIKFIQSRGLKPTSWKDFENYVEQNGGFLSSALRLEVHQLWNLQGNTAYAPDWSPRITPVGIDQYGRLWRYDDRAADFRMKILESLI